VQLFDLGGENGAPATSEDFDIGFGLPQQVDHVLEKLDVATLVGSEGDPLDIFGDGAAHDLGHRPVMTEMDHLGPGGLEQPAHNVDGGVVAVEQGGGTDQAHLVLRGVGGDILSSVQSPLRLDGAPGKSSAASASGKMTRP
jgi:hypothetical protein